jgi:hypothetical protein
MQGPQFARALRAGAGPRWMELGPAPRPPRGLQQPRGLCIAASAAGPLASLSAAMISMLQRTGARFLGGGATVLGGGAAAAAALRADNPEPEENMASSSVAWVQELSSAAGVDEVLR